MTVKLEIISPRGDPNPSQGYKTYNQGDQIVCTVSSSVTENSKVWTCKGWTGTGSVPSNGQGTSVTFPLTQDSTITWNWEGPTNLSWYKTAVAAQVATAIAFALISGVGAVAYLLKDVAISAILAGAVGRLLHEIVQSGGKYVLPNTDDKGNFCLGGLIGMVTGGLAGLIYYAGLSATAGMSAQLVIQAFLAGLAVKGVADAVNPPSSSSSKQPSSS